MSGIFEVEDRKAIAEAAAEAERDIAALTAREKALTTALEQTGEERQRATGGLILARKLLGLDPMGNPVEAPVDVEIHDPDPQPDPA